VGSAGSDPSDSIAKPREKGVDNFRLCLNSMYRGIRREG
jgi:hypothetical protein